MLATRSAITARAAPLRGAASPTLPPLTFPQLRSSSRTTRVAVRALDVSLVPNHNFGATTFRAMQGLALRHGEPEQNSAQVQAHIVRWHQKYFGADFPCDFPFDYRILTLL